jgi:autotransporter-associated beta strand protein
MLSVDFTGDGQPDPTAATNGQGSIVIVRSDPSSQGPRIVKTGTGTLDLTGSNTWIGPYSISVDPTRPNDGQIQDANPDASLDFPAEGQTAFFLRVTGPGPDGTAGTPDDVSLHTSQPVIFFANQLSQWPAYGAPWTADGPVALLDAQGAPQGQILSGLMGLLLPAVQTHPRRVSLAFGSTPRTVAVAAGKLHPHGRVVVRDPFFECGQEVAVRIERKDAGKWVVVKTVTTADDGTFAATIPSKAGSYRTEAVRVREAATPKIFCARALSPVVHA